MLHEGGSPQRSLLHYFQRLRRYQMVSHRLQFVLFGLRPHCALHLCRSPSNHSYGYDFSADRPTCVAHYALISETFMQHAG
jgi:hypothetical protein